MIIDFLRISLKSLKSRKIRSWLTMIGIFIGIAAVVALISLGNGLKTAINEQFEKMGVDKIMIMPSGGISLMGLSQDVLDKDDADFISRINGVYEVGAMLYKNAKVKYNDEQKFTFVIGLPTDESRKVIQSMQNLELAQGRELTDNDKYKATIGCEIINDKGLFSKGANVRENIGIEGKDFMIIGSVACLGNKQDDTQVYIPLDAARELFNEPDKVDAIIVQVKKGYEPSIVAERIKEKMRRDRDLDEGEENFEVQSSEQLIESFGIILMLIQIVLIGIAGVSLLVGGIGIMNTMYTSVYERTSEIGVMKAVGARNRSILLLFLIESSLMGAVGGVIGVLFGMLISYGVELGAKAAGFAYLSIKISIPLVLFGIAFAFVLGSLAGLLPAYTATRLQVVDALRYE